ncbi:MAG: primosomal protein N' family DNA-binding protein [bacterium]
MTESLFATPSSGIARVALPVPIDRLFDYRVPEAMDAGARAGHRVQVTFGGRPLVGLICERMQEDAPDAPQHTAELSDLDGVIDTQSVVSPALIQILRETASELLTPVGIALCAALPRGSAPRVVRHLALTPRGEAALQSGAADGQAKNGLTALSAGPEPSRANVRPPTQCSTFLNAMA